MSSLYPTMDENTKPGLIQQPSAPLMDRVTVEQIPSHYNLGVAIGTPSGSPLSEGPLSGSQLKSVALNLCLELTSILLGILGLFTQLFGLYILVGVAEEDVFAGFGVVSHFIYFITLAVKLMISLLSINFGLGPSAEKSIKFSSALTISVLVLGAFQGFLILVAIVLSNLGLLFSSEVWGLLNILLIADYATAIGAGLATLLLMKSFQVREC